MEVDRDEALVAELHRLGVRHLVRLRPNRLLPGFSPDKLLVGLATHPQARFRNALILLFLRRPDMSRFVLSAIEQLDHVSAVTLRLYYQAAIYLWPELEVELHLFNEEVQCLPDLFSAELRVPLPGSVPVDVALTTLGELHRRLSGHAYNWAESYRQHIPLFIRQLRETSLATVTA